MNKLYKLLSMLSALTFIYINCNCNVFAEEYMDEIKDEYIGEAYSVGSFSLLNEVTKDEDIPNDIIYEYTIYTNQEMDPDMDWEYMVNDNVECIRFSQAEDGTYYADITIVGNDEIIFYALPTGNYSVVGKDVSDVEGYALQSNNYVDGTQSITNSMEFYLGANGKISLLSTKLYNKIIEEVIENVSEESYVVQPTESQVLVIQYEQVHIVEKAEIQTINNSYFTGIGKEADMLIKEITK